MNKKYLWAVAASTLMLAACGDDVTNIWQSGLAVLEKGEKLSKQPCDQANVGEVLFVMDSSEAFVCDGESWQTLKGADGKDGKNGLKGDSGEDGSDGVGCSAKSVKNKAGLEGVEISCGKIVIDTVWNGKNGVDGKDGTDGTSCTATENKDGNFDFVCGGKKVGTIKNGTNGTSCTAQTVTNAAGLEGVEVTCGGAVVDTIWNGENGKPGDPGDAGTSCSAKSVKNKAGLEGLEVTCGKTVIDTIWNGKDGEAGESGDDGVGCSLKDDGDGKVTVTCGDGDDATTATLYKAVCGTKPYDPLKSFCSEGKLYSCDDKPYDPKKQFCKQGSTVEDYGWLTDTRDKQIYKTVKIGDQTWMAENLNYSVNLGERSWCGGGEAGKKNEGDCSVYGRLYTWAAAVGKSEDECGYGKTCTLPTVVQGVCPEGWHLPSNGEWNALFTAVGGASYAGQKLKADSDLWYEGTSNDDSFGFAVLPAGYRDDDGGFDYEGYYAYFWSSAEGNSDCAYYWDFRYGYVDVDDGWYNKGYGFSVRCLRD